VYRFFGALVLVATLATPSRAHASGVDFLPDAEPTPVVEGPPSKPWDPYQVAVALNLGLGSAVGGFGLTLSFVPAANLLTEVGMGVGFSGLQLSVMQKVLLGSGRARFAAGAGVSHGGGNRDFPDSSLWLNVDLVGMELRGWRGLVFFVAGGITVGLSGGRYIHLVQNDCGRTYCGDAVGEIWPQGRAGLGYWF
jgi:hypothetical protein